MLRNADGGGGVKFSGKSVTKVYTCNVISVMRGWVGVQIPGKKHYVTLEWPLIPLNRNIRNAPPPRHYVTLEWPLRSIIVRLSSGPVAVAVLYIGRGYGTESR